MFICLDISMYVCILKCVMYEYIHNRIRALANNKNILVFVQNLLSLNPVVRTHAKLVPNVVTQSAKKQWKRNKDKSCSVSSYFYFMNWWPHVLDC